MKTRPAIDRLLENCAEDEQGCWLYQRSLDSSGYVQIREGGRESKLLLGHRITWRYFRGDIPAGLQLDHLCRVRRCVNPWHLDAVTPRENFYRGAGHVHSPNYKAASRCAHGHAMTPENTYIASGRYRKCRTCLRDARIRSRREAA